MLVIAEGLQSASDSVRSACIEFLTPSILEHVDDLSYIFRQINCKLAFTN